MEDVRVVLAEDHTVVRSGIRSALEKLPGIEIVGEAANGIEAVERVTELCPDVLVLDMQMPVLDGLGVIERMAEQGLPVKVLVYSSYNEPYYISGVLEYGAAGYITKDEPPRRLAEAIRKVAKGQRGIFTESVENVIEKDLDG